MADGSNAAGSGQLEQRLRDRLNNLTYLPGSVDVAMKFIELGKDLDAGPAEYERTVSADAALGTKILALANSSWYGVRNRVTKVLQAITLLGLANVRTLAISYCMAGIHNKLKLPPEVSKRYWEASLCKGVAARLLARCIDEKLQDEAFLGGLFQDMAIPIMHVVGPEEITAILEDPQCDSTNQVLRERSAFGLDHTEVGRSLALKLELPEAYIDAIGFHHDAVSLSKFMESKAVAQGVHAAAAFPHVPGHWNATDAETLTACLKAHARGDLVDCRAFLAQVQKQFEELFSFFDSGHEPEMRLEALLADASEEIADSTTGLMGQVHDLMNEAAKTGEFVHKLVEDHEKVVDQSRSDALTGTLSRAAFMEDAARIVHTAGRHGVPFVVAFCDLDDFKRINDEHGHAFGDFVLREFCTRLRQRIRKSDLFGRYGGDEFVLLLNDITPDRAQSVCEAIMRSIREEAFVKGKVAETITMSMGVLSATGQGVTHDIEALLNEADVVMYRAKRSGPGQVRYQTYRASVAGASPS